MASSQSRQISWNYDVFLSFRGVDTRTTLVHHLYSALVKQQICACLYDEITILGRGPLAIFKAIEESRIAIIIFSTNYASSLRCLNEVAYIMKCRDERGQIVIPLYYDVNPSDVRNLKGAFGNEFGKQKQENTTELVEYWEKAILDASNLDGWDFEYITHWHELSKCIKQIVDVISMKLFLYKDHNKDIIKDMKDLKIPLQDILSATNTFAKEKIIAGGGFGSVYICQSKRHGIIAVKQLDRRGGQGDHEFMMEVALLSAYKHENLVSLIGFCDEGGQKILIYKYEKNGSLNNALLWKNLSWIQRLRICLGVACGLKYLHDDVGVQHRVLHRDIKSANILLDENWNAKISDFGLSKIALANVPCTVVISNACGTIGYIDPQYIKRGILTQKSDVYSFGIVLFEVLFGKLVSVAERLDKCHFSIKMAKTHYETETLEELIDCELRKQMDLKSFKTFSKVAYDCVKKRGEERPTMNEVMEELKKALDHQLRSVSLSHVLRNFTYKT